MRQTGRKNDPEDADGQTACEPASRGGSLSMKFHAKKEIPPTLPFQFIWIFEFDHTMPISTLWVRLLEGRIPIM